MDSREGGRGDGHLPPSASSRVQLEVDILASDLEATHPGGAPHADARARHAVLVVTIDGALADYIAQCLGNRNDLQVTVADDMSTAVAMVQRAQPKLVIADELRANIVLYLDGVPAILIVDEMIDAADRAAHAPLAFIVRPFNARALLAEVERILGG